MDVYVAQFKRILKSTLVDLIEKMERKEISSIQRKL